VIPKEETTKPWNLDLYHVAYIFRQDSHTRLTDAVFPSIDLNSGIVVADCGTFASGFSLASVTFLSTMPWT